MDANAHRRSRPRHRHGHRLVIGNPASGGSSAPELLPGFWRTLSQLLPPVAGVTSLRDVVYFDGHGSSHALIVLAVYAVLGGAVAMIARGLRTRAAASTPAAQTAGAFS